MWCRKMQAGGIWEVYAKLFPDLCSLDTPQLGISRLEEEKASQDSTVPAASVPKHLCLVCFPPSTTDEFIFKAENS